MTINVIRTSTLLSVAGESDVGITSFKSTQYLQTVEDEPETAALETGSKHGSGRVRTNSESCSKSKHYML